MEINPLKNIGLATSQSEELTALEQLKQTLSPNHDATEGYDLEHQWLSSAVDNLGNDGPCNPFPAYTPESLISCQTDLDRFTLYLFERRFSWSEANNHNISSSQKSQGRPFAAISTEQHAQLKERLNNILDEYLRWYMCQDVSLPLLKSLHFTFTQASNKPVVRNQTMVHIMEWLQLNSSNTCLHTNFRAVQSLVLCGLSDVWSAIRSACVTRLGHIASYLTFQEHQNLFTELVQICQDQGSTWQSVEGALMAINLLLKCFQWIGVLSTDTSEEQQHPSKGRYYLKFGEQELSQLPEFISSRIHTLVYPLLAHPQLAVRDNATKAFSTYLSRCDVKVALQSLKEAVTRLSKDGNFETWTSDHSSLHAVLQSDYTFLHACEAEGLLSVCLYLIKHLQSGLLLPYWPKHFDTFSLYLMHPASTVRQAASVLFKYIVAKESNNPGLLKLVLQSLCANWTIDIATNLLKCSSKYYHSLMQEEMRWKDDKGMKHDTLQRQFSAEQEKQLSIMALHHINNEDINLCEVWEWREGRLFAYELIVKFLIINHIHYLFPSYALPPSKFDGSVSADHAITHSQQKVTPQRPAMSKSFSHGGNSNESDCITSEYKCLTRTGSERRKIILEEKRSRTVAEGSFFKKQFSKHYSYFTNQPTLRDKRKNTSGSATSLLCKVRNMDAALKVRDEKLYRGSHVIPFPMLSRHPIPLEALPRDVEMLLNSACSASKLLGGKDKSDGTDWLQHVELQNLSALLRQMLLQTVSCLADGRWEVRRMAQQALPLITECIRWYDMSVLTSLWNQYLGPEETLICYGLAMTLAVSIHHAVRLIHFMDSPPVSWKEPEICRGITLPIVIMLTKGLSEWCDIILSLLNRTVVDKLTVVSMEIIMTAHINFPELLSERDRYEMAVVNKILHVFCHAHPEHPLSQQYSSDEYFKRLSTPVDGVLCCFSMAEQVESPACQLERYLLTELHHFLPSFLQSCSVQGACSLLGVLIHSVGQFGQDGQLSKNLLEGCLIVGRKVSRCMQQGKHEEEQLDQIIVRAMEEMTDVVLHKELELVTLKQILDLYLMVSAFVEATDQLTLMLSAVSTRFDLDSGRRTNQHCQDEKETTNLVYLSNNIPASSVDNGDSSDEDEDEDDRKHGSSHVAESLSLSMSSGSGQTLWPSYVGSDQDQHGLSLTRGSQDESESDWDSWDDEQEDQTAIFGVVSEFVQKLQGLCKTREQGRQLTCSLVSTSHDGSITK